VRLIMGIRPWMGCQGADPPLEGSKRVLLVGRGTGAARAETWGNAFLSLYVNAPRQGTWPSHTLAGWTFPSGCPAIGSIRVYPFDQGT